MNSIKMWYARDIKDHGAVIDRNGVERVHSNVTLASEQRLTWVAHRIARQVEGAKWRPFRCPGTTGWVLQWET